jgi:hypothetical protein
VLDRVEVLAKETPPVDNAASRFGNPAFKTFYDKVQQVRSECECDRDGSLAGPSEAAELLFSISSHVIFARLGRAAIARAAARTTPRCCR